jgi:catechol 2,3-dioxygenase-like lactoylglutathione lyase family enzyme
VKLLSSLLLLCLATSTAHAQLATPNANGITFGHVHLNVSDIAEHKRIWVEHFNGTVVERGPLTVVKLPNMMVALTETEPSMGSRETNMHHFGFKVRSMDKFLDKWRADGLEVGSIFFGSEGQLNAYVITPDNIAVEMQEDQGLHEEITGYHVHWFLDNPEEILQWYVEMFDLEIRPRGRITTTTNVPGMNLSFGANNSGRQNTQGSAIDHIGFEIDNLEEFCKQLEAKGIVFDIPYREIPAIGLNIAYFTDPSGVYVELTEGYDEY